MLSNLGYLGKEIDSTITREVVKRLSYSDWLILYYLAQVITKLNSRVLKRKEETFPFYIR